MFIPRIPKRELKFVLPAPQIDVLLDESRKGSWNAIPSSPAPNTPLPRIPKRELKYTLWWVFSQRVPHGIPKRELKCSCMYLGLLESNSESRKGSWNRKWPRLNTRLFSPNPEKGVEMIWTMAEDEWNTLGIPKRELKCPGLNRG